jgi:succinyl-CoA synthetase beta subunit
MRLAEIDGKALLRRHGLTVPRGVLLHATDGAPAEAGEWSGHMLKGQVLEGGRGKRGLICRLADLGELEAARQRIAAALADPAAPLLLEEAVAIAREIYLAVRIDGTRQGFELLVAAEGGEDVETTKALLRIPLDDATTADALYPDLARLFARDLAAQLARYATRLPEIVRREDLELLEINPLALTADGRLVACDAKIIRDENAAFRHDPEEFPLSRTLAERTVTPLERSARELGFHLVDIDGDIALVTAGAGLGMMMMDLLADHGLAAACFMDNLRGAPDETTAERLRIARAIAQRPKVKAIVFQTVLASRSLAERIEALLAWVAAEPLPKPLFVGIAAGHAAARKMSAEAAVAKLASAGIAAFTDPIALVHAVAAAVGGGPQAAADAVSDRSARDYLR